MWMRKILNRSMQSLVLGVSSMCKAEVLGMALRENISWYKMPKKIVCEGVSMDVMDVGLAYLSEIKYCEYDFENLYHTFRYFRISLNDVELWGRDLDDVNVKRLCIASLNSDGYVREAAVKLLIGVDDKWVFPFLLWALKDWVDEISVLARCWFEEALDSDRVLYLLDYWLITERLMASARNELGSLLVDLSKRFDDFSVKEIVGHLDCDCIKQRGFVYELLGDRLVGDGEWGEVVGGDVVPSLRWEIVPYVWGFEESVRRAWVERLIEDESSRIVCSVIHGMSLVERVRAHDRLLSLCYSNSRPMREAGRSYIVDVSKESVAGICREKILVSDIEDIKSGWVAGLGEVCGVGDYDLIYRCLACSRVSVRYEVYRVLVGLDKKRVMPDLLNGLDDQGRRVSRCCADLLLDDLGDVIHEYFYEKLFLDDGDNGYFSAKRALLCMPYWDRVPVLMLGVLGRDAAVREYSLCGIVVWLERYGSSWSKPSGVGYKYLVRAYGQYCEMVEGGEEIVIVDVEHQLAWKRLIRWIEEVI